ncbi:MAG: acylneuraminate cytidylyltransferase family protein [Candidatus Orphnella occulta]|nr:acylneuraminate cytidylyltransferase family protein [Candidatus Orphnella occulta]
MGNKKDKKVVALITARGGSKALPLKNIKSFSGKPLIYWTIKAAKMSKCANDIYVSTDNLKIAAISKKYGAKAPFLRPKKISTDKSSSMDAVLHFLEYLKKNENYLPDIFILLQPTSPLRTSKDIDKAFSTFSSNKKTDAVVSITEMPVHPYKAKAVSKGSFIKDFMLIDKKFHRRQDRPVAYSDNGAIYIYKTEAFLKERTFFPKNTLGYIMPKERSVDIDTPWDFYLAVLIFRSFNRQRGY